MRLRRIEGLRRHAKLIAALAAWQLASGVANVLLAWPLAIALAHTGGAAALVLVLTWALGESRSAVAVRQAHAVAGRERSA
jgi:cytochrome c oxidase assembly protein subunit 15